MKDQIPGNSNKKQNKHVVSVTWRTENVAETRLNWTARLMHAPTSQTVSILLKQSCLDACCAQEKKTMPRSSLPFVHMKSKKKSKKMGSFRPNLHLACLFKPKKFHACNATRKHTSQRNEIERIVNFLLWLHQTG